MKKLSFIAVMSLVFFTLASCGGNQDKKDAESTSAIVDDGASGRVLELNGDSDSMKAGGLSTVYFAYDSSSLSAATKSTLDANAEFLKANMNVEVQVEGHADERGGIQYNLALGERRAKTIKEYLVAKGVASARVTIVSYGKERPLEFGHDEAAWAKNRRGNFVVTAK